MTGKQLLETGYAIQKLKVPKMEHIKPITNLIQFQEVSRSLTKPLTQPSNEKPSERIASARNIAKLILGRYPDYNKAPPEYLAGIVAIIATFPISIQNKLADLRIGVTSVCEFLPSQAHIIKLGDRLESQENTERETKPLVKVYEGTPQWEAWQQHRGSTPCIDLRDEQENICRGWYFPTEYPK